MTKKQYGNFSLILRQMLDYAVELSIVSENQFRKVKIDNRLFRRVKKQSSETQVYFKAEKQKLEEIALEDFRTNKRRKKYPLVPLAILFQFETGLRVGELCALEYGDLEESEYIHVQRMYQRDFKKIIEHAKTEYGDRLIVLTDKAKRIIEMARAYQSRCCAEPQEFIFSTNGEPLSAHAVNDALKKYCGKLGIMNKSSHKVRKTYISTLIGNNVNINTVRELAGHSDERTTYNCYCFDTNSEDEKVKLIKDALA